MAELVLGAFALMGGFVGGTLLQTSMRAMDIGVYARIGIELMIMLYGALNVKVSFTSWRPAEFPFLGVAVFFMGAVAMFEGATVNAVNAMTSIGF